MNKKETRYSDSMDHARMMTVIEDLCRRYDALSVRPLTQSIMGREIPILSLGEGKRSVLYIGAHHGMEWITTTLLLRFVEEYCELRKQGKCVYGYDLDFVDRTRNLLILPMLNPDGVDYAIHGVDEKHIMRERLLAMNGGDCDFSHWQANARGVDLNHNYDSGFEVYKKLEAELGLRGGAPGKYSGEYPESEPEVAALCNFMRFNDSIRMVLTLHTQGEEIYYTSGELTAPRSLELGRTLSRLTGYRLAHPEGTAAYGGFTDWCVEKLGKPSFTVECGKGKNPLPLSQEFSIYSRLREMLFTAPTLV